MGWKLLTRGSHLLIQQVNHSQPITSAQTASQISLYGFLKMDKVLIPRFMVEGAYSIQSKR